jgi:hypothetical protein
MGEFQKGGIVFVSRERERNGNKKR